MAAGQHQGHQTQRKLAFHLLSGGRDLDLDMDLDMVAFLLATLVSLEDRGKVIETQRRW